MSPVCGNKRTNRDARSMGMKIRVCVRRGEESRRREKLRRMLGMWRDARDFFEGGEEAVDLAVGKGWMSGAERWSFIMNKHAVKDIGRI